MRFLIFLFLACVLPPLVVYLDVRDGGNLGEVSFTELGQSALLAGAILSLVFLGLQNTSLKVAALVAAGLGLVAFVREQEAYFDQVFHGLWASIAVILLVLLAFYAVRNRAEFMQGARTIMSSQVFYVLALGGLFVLIQSRIFGTTDLWVEIVSTDQVLRAKTIVQEGLELTGYALILSGCLEYSLRSTSRSKHVVG